MKRPHFFMMLAPELASPGLRGGWWLQCLGTTYGFAGHGKGAFCGHWCCRFCPQNLSAKTLLVLQ